MVCAGGVGLTNTNMETTKIIEALKAIKENPRRSFGICYNLYQTLDIPIKELYKVDEKLFSIFPKWEHYSGDKEFPVPCPEGGDPEMAYDVKNVWAGKYGEYRYKLLDFLIQEFEKELHS